MKKFLRSEIDEKMRLNETLAVGDSKLGSAIAKKMGMKVVNDASVNELMRGIRSQLESLVTGSIALRNNLINLRFGRV